MRIRESIFKKIARNLEISIAVLEGETLQRVAAKHGITGPRAGTILHGVISDCNRRYKQAYDKNSGIEHDYLKNLRLRKDDIIPFIKKWGNPITPKDIWKLDIPLINKVFWNSPNKRLTNCDQVVMETFINDFPEEAYRILNKALDKLDWQLAVTYADRIIRTSKK